MPLRTTQTKGTLDTTIFLKGFRASDLGTFIGFGTRGSVHVMHLVVLVGKGTSNSHATWWLIKETGRRSPASFTNYPSGSLPVVLTFGYTGTLDTY